MVTDRPLTLAGAYFRYPRAVYGASPLRPTAECGRHEYWLWTFWDFVWDPCLCLEIFQKKGLLGHGRRLRSYERSIEGTCRASKEVGYFGLRWLIVRKATAFSCVSSTKCHKEARETLSFQWRKTVNVTRCSFGTNSIVGFPIIVEWLAWSFPTGLYECLEGCTFQCFLATGLFGSFASSLW